MVIANAKRKSFPGKALPGHEFGRPEAQWPSSQCWIGSPALGGQLRQAGPPCHLHGGGRQARAGLVIRRLAASPVRCSRRGFREHLRPLPWGQVSPLPSGRGWIRYPAPDGQLLPGAGRGSALRCHFGLSARPASASSPAHPFALAAGHSVNQAPPRQNAAWALAKKMRTAGRAGG